MVVEKGFEVGVYIFFGVVFELCVFNELFFNWKEFGVLLNIEVGGDEIFYFIGVEKGFKVFNLFVFKIMYNEGNYVIFLGNLCCWFVE